MDAQKTREMGGTLSRRNFLTGAGIAALGAASLGLVGCGQESDSGAQKGGSVSVDYLNSIKWDAEYDVVVVGFGGAGCVSSITAADAGAKVLLTEKAPLGDEGGNTRYCEQQILFVDDYDEGVKFMKGMAHGFDTATDDIIDFMVRGSMENRDWLISMGADKVDSSALAKEYGFTMEGEFGNWLSDDGTMFCEFPERIMPGGNYVRNITISGTTDGGRKLYWKLMRKNVVDRTDSIDVWFESPAVKIIQDPLSKVVLGVSVNRKGQEVNVRAKNGVILSCGSYEANMDMYETYGGLPVAYPMGSLYNTGDGIDMAKEIGADLWHMNAFSGPWLAPKQPNVDRTYFCGMYQRFTNGGSCIYVGGDGTRFVAESGWHKHGHINYSGTWKSQIAPDVMYAVFDQKAKDSGGQPMNTVDEEQVISANTIAELATAIDINTDSLTATVERYNRYCDGGVDEQFNRHPDTLDKISASGPYYAVRLFPGCVNCQGGPVRNTKCEVLDRDGNPIPRLYSAGELGSFWAGLYDGGGNIAETMYSGRAAGANAATVKDNPVPTVVESVSSSPENLGNDLADNGEEVVLGENEYLGVGEGLHGEIKSKVTVEGGRVTDVEIVEQHETEGMTDEVWTTMREAIIASGGTDVDTISGATIASNGLIASVNDALTQAG
jgi:succinate dehydrogenase/fumarate reductase flavoprotein subunit/uncharacterized protein with FMN-binding domain